MQKFLVASFKSNKTTQEVSAWLNVVSPEITGDSATIIVCPQFPALPVAALALGKGKNTNIKLGAQNVSAFGVGAYTGEVAAETIKDTVQYSIVGHSERRTLFNETSEVVQKKVEQLTKSGIRPILCISEETLGEASSIQEDGIVAFEPPSAIGVGTTEDPAKIAEVVAKLQTKTRAPILYGGSVSAETVGPLLAIEGVSGFLVGSASLDAAKFLELYHAIR